MCHSMPALQDEEKEGCGLDRLIKTPDRIFERSTRIGLSLLQMRYGRDVSCWPISTYCCPVTFAGYQGSSGPYHDIVIDLGEPRPGVGLVLGRGRDAEMGDR